MVGLQTEQPLLAAGSALGPVYAAFGPIEARGRGSLHPHVLVWLVLLSLQEALKLLLRDRRSFREHIRRRMQEPVRAVMSVQHSSVLQFPRLLVDQVEASTVNELPFGPAERRHFRTDGEPELPEPQGVHADEAAEPNHLLVESRQQQSAEGYVRAIRPHLAL